MVNNMIQYIPPTTVSVLLAHSKSYHVSDMVSGYRYTDINQHLKEHYFDAQADRLLTGLFLQLIKEDQYDSDGEYKDDDDFLDVYGSAVEGGFLTNIVKSDFDVMMNMALVNLDNLVKFEYSQTNPGYMIVSTQLHDLVCDQFREYKFRQCLMKKHERDDHNEEWILSSSRMKQKIEMSMSEERDDDDASVTIDKLLMCTSIPMMVSWYKFMQIPTDSDDGESSDEDEPPQGELGDSFKFDYVPALQFGMWPAIADSWINRKRHWPPKNVIQSVVNSGHHIVPKRSKSSAHEWRLSFSEAEKQIAAHRNKVMKLCFFICKSIIHNACSHKIVTSYVLKTLFNWYCEKVPGHHWKQKKTAQIIIEVLDSLIHCLVAATCPNYFIPEQNLFDDASVSSLRTAAQHIVHLRCNMQRIEHTEEANLATDVARVLVTIIKLIKLDVYREMDSLSLKSFVTGLESAVFFSIKCLSNSGLKQLLVLLQLLTKKKNTLRKWKEADDEDDETVLSLTGEEQTLHEWGELWGEAEETLLCGVADERGFQELEGWQETVNEYKESIDDHDGGSLLMIPCSKLYMNLLMTINRIRILSCQKYYLISKYA